MAGPTNDGVNLHVAWETVQWGLGAIGSMVMAALMWILRLGRRVDRLEVKVAQLPDREFIEAQTQALGARIDRLYDRQ